MFAVVSYNGNQYKLTPGQEALVDLLDEGKKNVEFNDVLLISDEKGIIVGQPTIAGASVKSEVIGEELGEKVRVFKFHAKKRYKRETGHRQHFTKIKVLEINKNDK